MLSYYYNVNITPVTIEAAMTAFALLHMSLRRRRRLFLQEQPPLMDPKKTGQHNTPHYIRRWRRRSRIRLLAMSFGCCHFMRRYVCHTYIRQMLLYMPRRRHYYRLPLALAIGAYTLFYAVVAIDNNMPRRRSSIITFTLLPTLLSPCFIFITTIVAVAWFTTLAWSRRRRRCCYATAYHCHYAIDITFTKNTPLYASLRHYYAMPLWGH